MANQDFRRMTPGVTQDAMQKRIDRLERGGAGTPSVFRKPISFAPEPEAGPGVSITSVTDPNIESHNTFVIYAADGETILLRADNAGNLETTGRVNADTPRFLVYAGGQTLTEGTVRVNFANVIYDAHSVFNPGENWCTVPSDWAGTWAFSAAVSTAATTNTGVIRIEVISDPNVDETVNFNTVRSANTNYKQWDEISFPLTVAAPYVEVDLVAGELVTVELITQMQNGANFALETDPETFFWGKWIHD